MREVVGRRDVEVSHGEGHGELAGRVGLAAEHVCNCAAAFLAGSPGEEHCIGDVFPGCGLDYAADVEHHHELLACCVIDVGQGLHQLALGSGEGPVAVGCLAVVAFSGVAADGEDCHVGAAEFTLDEGAADFHLGHYRVAEEDAETVAGGVVALGGLLQLDELVVPGLDVGIGHEAVLAEAVCHVEHVCLVDVAAAGAACDEVIGCGAVEGHAVDVL